MVLRKVGTAFSEPWPTIPSSSPSHGWPSSLRLTRVAGEPDPDFKDSMLDDHVAVLVVSARPDDADYKQVTIDWLAANDILYDRLYMRKGGRIIGPIRSSRGKSFSRSWTTALSHSSWWTDRPQVVEMWRSYGLTCLQCAPDETRSLHEGKTLLHMMVGPSGSGKSTYCKAHYKPGRSDLHRRHPC